MPLPRDRLQNDASPCSRLGFQRPATIGRPAERDSMASPRLSALPVAITPSRTPRGERGNLRPIGRMSRANLPWARLASADPLKLGVGRDLPRHSEAPAPTWRSFSAEPHDRNRGCRHGCGATATFRLLYDRSRSSSKTGHPFRFHPPPDPSPAHADAESCRAVVIASSTRSGDRFCSCTGALAVATRGFSQNHNEQRRIHYHYDDDTLCGYD